MDVSARQREEAILPDVKHKFFDHICGNTSERSTISVLKIVEILAQNIRRDQPIIKGIVLRTDNPANYHTHVLRIVTHLFSRSMEYK